MPDPWQYLQAIVLAAAISGLIARVAPDHRSRATSTYALAAALAGAAAGLAWLRWLPSASPVTALDRVLALVVPTVGLLEVMCLLSHPSRWHHVARGFVAFLIGPTVLYGSTYVAGSSHSSNKTAVITGLIVGGTLMAGSWTWLHERVSRTCDRETIWILSASMATTGLAIVLTGYLRGGITAIVIAPAIALATPKRAGSEAIASIASVAWVLHGGLLLVGCFFGRLGAIAATALVLAPIAYILLVTPFSGPNTKSARRVGARLFALTLLIVAMVHAAFTGSFLTLR